MAGSGDLGILGMRDGQLEAAHRTAVIDRNLDDIVGVGLGDRARQEAHPPDAGSQDRDADGDRNENLDERGQVTNSNTVALAVPPPSHIVCRP